MAEVKYGQVVLGPLSAGQGDFAILDSNQVAGGRFIVATIGDRNNIPAHLRKEGMYCFVTADKREYRLAAGAPTTGPTVSANWEEVAITLGSGSGGSGGGHGGGGGSVTPQVVEDIEFRDPVASGAAMLWDYLKKLRTDVDGKISTHQKVEDLRFNDAATAGFSTLSAYLADLKSKVGAAAGDKYIEDINWRSTPEGHQSSLEAELKSLTNPKNIKLPTGTPGNTISLEDKIKELEDKVPKAEQITNAGGTGILQLIADASDPTKIKVDGSKTLTEALTDIDSKISAASVKQKVEDIEYQTATAAGYTKLTQTLATINDPDKIIVDTGNNTTLTEKLRTLSIAASGAVQHVEDITWTNAPTTEFPEFASGLSDTLKGLYNKIKAVADSVSTPTGVKVENITWNSVPADHQASLSDELTSIVTNAKDLKTNVDALPAKVEDFTWNNAPAGHQANLGADLTEIRNDAKDLKTKVDALPAKVEDFNWNSAPAGHQTNLGADLTGIRNDAKDLKTKVEAIPTKIEDIPWNSKPAGDEFKDKLGDQITDIVTKLKDSNKSDKIMVGTDTLEQALEKIKNAAQAAVPPQTMLVNVNTPEVGPVTSCEYLTMYKAKMEEIAVYTNADATLTTPIVLVVEFCGAADSAYQSLAQTTITLQPSQAGKLIRTNTASAATPILIDDNTRLRVNIKSLGTSDTIGSINVRLTIRKTEETGNFNTVG